MHMGQEAGRWDPPLNSMFSVSVNAVATNELYIAWRYSGGKNPAAFGATGVFDAAIDLRFLSDQSGATAIEYCLIAVGLSIVIITAVNGIGSTLNGKFGSINSSLK